MRRSSSLRSPSSFLLAASAALLAPTPSAGAGLADSPWPMLQGDPRHSGQSPLLGPHFQSGAPSPGDVVKWTGFDKVKSSPTIAPDGTIYVGVGWSVCAINPQVVNGALTERWCRRLVGDASPSSAVISDDGTISVDNGAVPRFGVILRYQDAQNFYVAYRKPGGASFVRIARVVGGVETVLAQTGIPSPKLNAFFLLSGSASGTTLSLGVDGVPKLSVEDATFTNGSVGVLIDPGTSATSMHRIDNFAADVR
jgi:hypothetical protein